MPNTENGSARKQRFQQRLGVLHASGLHRKLRQHPPAACNSRWTRRHGIHAILFATIGALTATIAPGFPNALDAPVGDQQTLALALPPISAARKSGSLGGGWQLIRIRSGQTPGTLFDELSIPTTMMYRLLQHPDTREALTRLRPGTEIAFDLPVSGALRAIRFERDGKAEYFGITGRRLKKSFIRMPIPYARLNSTFGARRHPILGTMRMHKGVDHAASSGTPIMAAGDARGQFVDRQNGYGKVVVLDHGRGYSTLYGHRSHFGKIRAGERIRRAVIGYVGMTGLATGPHLHYEFRVNGQQRNPATVTRPPPEPLHGAQLAASRAQSAPALARMESVKRGMYAEAGPAKSGSGRKG